MKVLLSILIINVFFSLLIGTGKLNEFATDIFNFINKTKLNYITIRKPLGCEFCMVWWTTLLYLLIVCDYSNYLYIISIPAIAIINAFATRYTLYIWRLIDSFLTKMAVLLERLINKI